MTKRKSGLDLLNAQSAFLLGVGLWIAAIPLGLSYEVPWAHFFYLVGFALTVPAILRVMRESDREKWAVRTLSFAIAMILIAGALDYFTVRTPRAELLVAGAEIRVASPGKPYEAVVKLKNVGHSAILRMGTANAIGAGRFVINDITEQAVTEDYVFELAKVDTDIELTEVNVYGPNSELNSYELKGQHRLALPDEIAYVASGEGALYVAGRFRYLDAAGEQHQDFCFFWNMRVSSGPEMTLCHTHQS